MSIVRIGLAETKNFAEGYDAIFGKKKNAEPAQDEESKEEESPAKNKTADKKKKEGRKK